jgi:hypothetical protein
MSTGNIKKKILGSKGRLVRKDETLIAICEPIV